MGWDGFARRAAHDIALAGGPAWSACKRSWAAPSFQFGSTHLHHPRQTVHAPGLGPAGPGTGPRQRFSRTWWPSAAGRKRPEGAGSGVPGAANAMIACDMVAAAAVAGPLHPWVLQFDSQPCRSRLQARALSYGTEIEYGSQQQASKHGTVHTLYVLARAWAPRRLSGPAAAASASPARPVACPRLAPVG